eukprot:339566-Rhodomonas_salina.1
MLRTSLEFLGGSGLKGLHCRASHAFGRQSRALATQWRASQIECRGNDARSAPRIRHTKPGRLRA